MKNVGKSVGQVVIIIIIINIFQGEFTFHVAQIVNTEQLQHCAP